MEKISLLVIEKKIKYYLKDVNLKENNLIEGSNISPMSIIRLSTQFPSLNIAREDIALVYDKSLLTTNKGFILTNTNIHFAKGYLSLQELDKLITSDSQLIIPELDLAESIKEKLVLLFKDIANYDPSTNTNLSKFGKEETDNSVAVEINTTDNNSTVANSAQAVANDLIDKNLVTILQHQGDAYWEICKKLDDDKEVTTVLQQMSNKTDVAINNPSVKELLVQDLIKIYNICGNVDGSASRREQFMLAYLFERLLGKGDMADKIKISRLNDMVQNPNFAKQIEELQNFSMFKVTGTFPNELLLPVLLSRLEHEQFNPMAAQLYRFAQLLAKADGTVTKEEEEALKQVWTMAHKPKKAIPNVKQLTFNKDETLEDVIAELNELIGLKNIKEEVQTLINFLKVQQLREKKGLAVQDRSLHAVFMGPPGTGKTTIARLLAKIYKQLDVITSGHLVETDRAGLVAGYIGQTAQKTDEVVKAAIDGVLFIDEAYALSRGGSDKRDFGNEAIETLLKRMEDHRKQLIVIVAGYPDEMEDFIKSNPGLQSRFTRYFNFIHYQPQELLDILKLFAKKADFTLTEDAEEKLLFIFEDLYEKRHRTFGNARVARNIFEQCIERQANRIVSLSPITEKILITLTEADIPPVKETVKSILVFDEEKERQLEEYKQVQQIKDLAKNFQDIAPPEEEEE